MAKTIQALKITASWTPNAKSSERVMKAVGVKWTIGGGRLTLKRAIATDYANPAHTALVSARLAEMKADLEDAGTLHSFAVVAGAVPQGTADIVVVPPEASEEEAAAAE